MVGPLGNGEFCRLQECPVGDLALAQDGAQERGNSDPDVMRRSGVRLPLQPHFLILLHAC